MSADKCTCPTGDGSLRWPCPAHLPMSDATLFDLTPAALVYRQPTTVPMHKMRCRECHKRGAINGGGANGEFAYAVCDKCFHDRGELGGYARRGGTAGRPLIVIEPDAGMTS